MIGGGGGAQTVEEGLAVHPRLIARYRRDVQSLGFRARTGLVSHLQYVVGCAERLDGLTGGRRSENCMRPVQLALAAALITGLAACAAKKPPPPPPPAVVISKPLQKKIVDWDDFIGRFEAINSVDIRPRGVGLSSVHRLRRRPDRPQGPGAVRHRPAPLPGRTGPGQGPGGARGRRPVQRQDRAGARRTPAGRQGHRRAGIRDPAGDRTAGLRRRDRRARQRADRRLEPAIHPRDLAPVRPGVRPPGGAGQPGDPGPDRAHQHRRPRPDPVHLRRSRGLLS